MINKEYFPNQFQPPHLNLTFCNKISKETFSKGYCTGTIHPLYWLNTTIWYTEVTYANHIFLTGTAYILKVNKLLKKYMQCLLKYCKL